MANIFKRGRKAEAEPEELEAGAAPAPEGDALEDGVSTDEATPAKKGFFSRGAKTGGAAKDPGKGFSLPFLSKGAAKEQTGPQEFDPAAEIVPAEDVDVEYDGEGALKIGKARYALALEWRSVDTNMKRAEQAELVTETSRHDNVGLFVDLPRVDVVGFGAKGAGHRAGMKVLLTSMSRRHMGENWIGAFRIGTEGDVWWVGAVKDGSPYEDVVVQSEEDARIAVLNELSAGWTRIVGPADWGLPKAIDARLIDVLSSGKALQLREVAPIKAAMPKILGGVALFALLGGGYHFYSQSQEAERMRLAEELRIQRETVRLVPSEFPWHLAAPITEFLETCQSEIAQTIVLVPGWEAEPLTCVVQQGTGVVSTNWVRTENGRIEWLRLAMPESTASLVLSAGGVSAALSREFEGPQDVDASRAEPWSSSEIERIVRQRFQNLGLDILMNEERTGSTRRGGNARQVSYSSHTIQLRTTEAIDEWVQLLADIPALVPEVLIYSLDSGEWNLVAKAYHPPQTGR